MAYFLIIAAVLLRIAPHLSNYPALDAITRFLPNIPNFAPIAAMALFGGVYLNKKYALIVPLAAMIVSDLFIGFYNPWLMASVYGSFIAIGLIGMWLKNNKTISNTIAATLTGSVLFFLVTNFIMWLIQPYMVQALYPQSLQGLLSCYTMGLPFFRNTLMGDIFYVTAMFATAEAVMYVKSRVFESKEKNQLI